MAEQLNLPLGTRTALGRDDYFVTPGNAPVLDVMESWQNWPSGTLAIVGPAGSGKTHLAQVFATLAGARVVAGSEITAGQADAITNGPLVIDDADRVGDETGFFHIYNLMAERDHPLLMTATRAPVRWDIQLADLISRLGTVPIAEIPQPDDMLMTAVLAKHFADRGIAPPAHLIPYLVPRIERSLGAAARIVAQLDQRALSEGRTIGRGLAAEVLDNQGDDGA